MDWKTGWLALVVGGLSGIALAEAGKNLYASYPPVHDITEGIAWPKGQALPIFATPAIPLDAIEVQSLSADEQITFSALQGLVNQETTADLSIGRAGRRGPGHLGEDPDDESEIRRTVRTGQQIRTGRQTCEGSRRRGAL